MRQAFINWAPRGESAALVARAIEILIPDLVLPDQMYPLRRLRGIP